MKLETWSTLLSRQRHVMLLAMYVRNALEDFHVAHLSDEQMKEVNQTIRQALYEAVTLIEANDTDESQATVGWLVQSIPDYWEIPGDGRKITAG